MASSVDDEVLRPVSEERPRHRGGFCSVHAFCATLLEACGVSDNLTKEE